MIGLHDTKRAAMVEKVLNEIEEKKIKYCWLHFLDINGILKSYGVRATRMTEILDHGEGFDGSSINGYGVLEESDMVGLPDPSTFSIIPWRGEDELVGRFICDIYNPDGSRYAGDPRYILQQQVDRAKSMGYTLNCAPELEFFWLKPGEPGTAPTATDLRGYFDADPEDTSQLMRREVAMFAESFPSLTVDTIHHEVAKSQHEVDIRYGPAVEIADAAMTLKMIVKVVGARHDFLGTFIPKPFFGHNGSGMHVHQSLWQDGNNVFFDKEDPNQISDIMRSYIGGQLKYASDMMVILNSWPNSYKRLVPGYEAPTLCAWGFKNRSSQIRVPNFFNKASAARCEIRSPDGAGNIYLQIAVLLASGLDGIEENMTPPAPVDVNLFHMPDDELEKMGVEYLPGSMYLALKAFKKSAFMKKVLGDTCFNAYLNAKTEENKVASAQISEWELARYSTRV